MTRTVLTAACAGAAKLGIEQLHGTCRGNGPYYLPGMPHDGAPVLPAEACDCSCHKPTAAADRRGQAPPPAAPVSAAEPSSSSSATLMSRA